MQTFSFTESRIWGDSIIFEEKVMYMPRKLYICQKSHTCAMKVILTRSACHSLIHPFKWRITFVIRNKSFAFFQGIIFRWNQIELKALPILVNLALIIRGIRSLYDFYVELVEIRTKHYQWKILKFYLRQCSLFVPLCFADSSFLSGYISYSPFSNCRGV